MEIVLQRAAAVPLSKTLHAHALWGIFYEWPDPINFLRSSRNLHSAPKSFVCVQCAATNNIATLKIVLYTIQF